jgi:hypothetical protein
MINDNTNYNKSQVNGRENGNNLFLQQSEGDAQVFMVNGNGTKNEAIVKL